MKEYRISVFNRKTQQRELIWATYRTKKQAQRIADAINNLDNARIIDAKVIVKERVK